MSKGRKLVFDIETNGLLMKQGKKPAADKVWMIVAFDIESNEEFIFCDYTSAEGARPLAEFQGLFNSATELIAHNGIAFDLPVMKKLLGWQPNPKTSIRDTMLMSQMLDYNRFGGRHALALWGEHLGVAKPVHEDWENFSEEMVHRCREDVRINEKVYRLLARELTNTLKALTPEKQKMFKRSLRVEHQVSEFSAQCTEGGWVFDLPAARKLQFDMECEMTDIESRIVPKLRVRAKQLDKEPREPKFRKDGYYMMTTSSFFKLEQENGLGENRVIDGPYTRVEFIDPDMSSMDAIKLHLYAIGWDPLDWNWEKRDGKFIKKSPKLCSESLGLLGADGKDIDTYTTTKSRLGILNGWVASLDSDMRLRGDMFVIATPTGRSRHKTIVNVPSGNATWGPQMRALFGCEEGYKVVGADSSGNQFRALCHYIKDDDFTNEVINGDVHQKNADILGCDRSTAKPWIGNRSTLNHVNSGNIS